MLPPKRLDKRLVRAFVLVAVVPLLVASVLGGYIIVMPNAGVSIYGVLWVIVALLMTTGLAAFWVGTLFARRITGPMALLEEGVRKLGSGELAHRITVRTGDEIESLAGEINQMAGSFERSRAETEAASRERERLYRQSASRAKEMTALHLVALEIGAQLDLNLMLKALVRRAVELLHADAGAVYFSDAEGQELQMVVSHQVKNPYAGIRLRRGEGAAGYVLVTEQPLVVNDYPNWPGRAKFDSEWPFALACVPLFGVHGPLGVLSVMSTSPARTFSPDDLDLLGRFGAQAAIAIQNARAYQAEQQARLLAQKLREAALMLGSSLDLDELLRGIWEQLRQVVAYDSGTIFLLEQDQLRVRSTVGFDQAQVESVPIRLSENALTKEIARTGQVLILPDAEADSRFVGLPDSPPIRGWMGVPLYVRGRLIGLMTLDKHEPNFYRPQDAEAAQAFAAQVAVAIENARLYADEQQRATELAETLSRTQELDRLKTEFMQNTSHELRTPLTLIRGYAEMLETDDIETLAPNQRKAVRIIRQRAYDLSKLVEGMMTILQVEAGVLVVMPVSLQDVARQTARDLQPVADKAGVSLCVQVEGNPAPVEGDPSHLQRVLDNLISNALKFTPTGGSVAVSVREEAGGVQAEVSDTGIGVPPDRLDKVFDRFYQVDGTARRRYGGVGLGLAIVKQVIEAHHGRVGIASEMGKGTTVWFWLPMSRGYGT